MIFISHASEDYEALKDWIEFFETFGATCWISERDLLQEQSSWAESIMKAMDACDSLFLYLTRNSAISGQVVNEIHNASAKGMNVIPFLAEDITLSDELQYLIKKYEWVYAFKYESQDTLKNIVRKRLLENVNEDRKQFWKVTSSNEFKNFQFQVLKKYYGDSFFTTINGKMHPVYEIIARPLEKAIESIKDYDCLCDFENSMLFDFNIEEHQDYVNLPWYKEYSNILSGKIRYPNRPGYMLDEFIMKEDNSIDKIRVHVGTYAENVYSTHVLEYEMYRTFLQYGQSDLNDETVWNKILNTMKVRNHIHASVNRDDTENFEEQMKKSLLRGDGHDSLLSVQMAVIIKSSRTHKYELKFVQRSTQVAVKPGVYQLIPAGGFEILNDSDDDIYDDMELEDNYSPGCAIFREFIEELYNVPEFEGGGGGSIEDRLLKDPHIIDIENMLRDGRAEFLFLGSVLGLDGLRHELSFALVVHDESYSENRFLANEECKKGRVNSVPISDFNEKKSVWKLLHEPSAALWDLFTKSDLYKKLL